MPVHRVWQPFDGEVSIRNPHSEALVAQAQHWMRSRLQPLRTNEARALRMQPPILACRPAPAAACAARIVVEVLGHDGATPLRAMEGRAEFRLSGNIDEAALKRAMPELLEAALAQALKARDLRPPASGEIERLSRREDRSMVPRWRHELEQPHGRPARRAALWIALGHVGIEGDLPQLESIQATHDDEARARARALRWIRAATRQAGKTPLRHVKSGPGAKGGSP